MSTVSAQFSAQFSARFQHGFSSVLRSVSARFRSVSAQFQFSFSLVSARFFSSISTQNFSIKSPVFENCTSKRRRNISNCLLLLPKVSRRFSCAPRSHRRRQPRHQAAVQAQAAAAAAATFRWQFKTVMFITRQWTHRTLGYIEFKSTIGNFNAIPLHFPYQECLHSWY